MGTAFIAGRKSRAGRIVSYAEKSGTSRARKRRAVDSLTRSDGRILATTDYPLDVSLVLTYELSGGSVRTTFHFQNHETEKAAHLGFGLHPGFVTTEGAPFSFQMPAGKYRRYFSPNNYLAAETQTFHFAGGQMPVLAEQLPGSFIVELVDVPERIFRFEDGPSGRTMLFDFSEVPYLTLWSDGGPFLCVEPCWGLTDHDEQRAFENKEGIQIVPARGELRRSFTMTPGLTSKE